MAENSIQASSGHSFGTRFRESGNCSIPKVMARNHFVYKGCILWNDLPSHRKEKRSIYDFKTIVNRIVLYYILYVKFPFCHFTVYWTFWEILRF